MFSFEADFNETRFDIATSVYIKHKTSLELHGYFVNIRDFEKKIQQSNN